MARDYISGREQLFARTCCSRAHCKRFSRSLSPPVLVRISARLSRIVFSMDASILMAEPSPRREKRLVPVFAEKLGKRRGGKKV